MVVPFKNEPGIDFSVQENVERFQKTLEQVKSELGQTLPIVIDGEHITKDDTFDSINPANTKELIAKVSKATKEDVDKAFESSNKAYKTWRQWSHKDRAELLLRVAAIIRRRKEEISAVMVYEAGKPWDEAVGDAAEGIDFIEYYARSMMELADGKPVLDREGEHNKYFYKSIGTGVTIPPWNFPFAIMAGTTLAPVVAGNTVLLKPAEDTVLTAYKLIEILEEAGLPKGVVNFVPGDPKEIGDYLVDSVHTQFVTFTGSRATGTRIYERSAVVQEGQTFLKRVIAEMGGKDAIVVDENIDTDLAAESIVTSAFGFSGQKCSACSRAIVHSSIYDEVLEKAVALTKELTVGNTVDNTFMGPVINKKQFDKIKKYIEIGGKEGKIEIGGEADDSTGYFIKPTIISGLKSSDQVMQEEIFGPVVGFTKFDNFEEAIEIANDTDYGLTGAVITNNRENWIKAVNEFEVGNLYLNRGCTSAVVGYHPFGGFKMSGTDAKTGSPDYLLNFLEQKVVSEMF
ncbi:L-glutamate gamma-semialdehyde dehydrogenase [Staphylococcus haemolyticus]|uniref:L-glutamate gamma-semialdehyde dehydrogenase n=1 Tax=Staphylococcus haemolyticus TaxID=1283 RepID=UPI001374AEB8|nr:L-glutamate gamma-semialdehyde dehydrogenase [Staphylococcus haemolyticus]QUX18230.1 L-glutamate gamma-semialdehyde dehydrogenase [Staphylococcus haemolyticus]UCI00210.1 L-glutamate gamma-semialdehyde dehydrogenase [Staphylococcus haemolyticus]UCI02427.1 L-glutamate gamma-semialdehyde dehydrogenase [Staphylococcus haemolyticus]